MRRDEIVADWVNRLIGRLRAAYRARLRDRGRRCIRCGSLATAECTACGALACNRCWLPSIETGEVAALCLDCTGTPSPAPSSRHDVVSSARAGAVMLGWMLLGLVVWAAWKDGALGSWRIVSILFDPGVLLGLIPLAFLLGALRAVAIRSLQALLRSPSKQSP